MATPVNPEVRRPNSSVHDEPVIGPDHQLPAGHSAHRVRNNILRILIAVVVLGGGLYYFKFRHTSNAADTAGGGSGSGRGGGGEGRVVPVQVAVAERKDMPIWLDGLGTVAALQQVTVHVQVDGRLDKVLFTEGQEVHKGDVLAEVDPRAFYVQLHNAQGALARDTASRDTSMRNLKRYQDLFQQKLVAQQSVDQYIGEVGQFEGAMKIDQSQIEMAQLNLDYAKVKSPLDGITGVRLIDAGNIVHAADVTGLVVITAINPAAVLFTVPQDRLTGISAALARGDVPVEIRAREGGDPIAKGTLAVLDNQINQTTATLKLKAVVPNPERKLWPNAFVKASMLLETRKDALVIPAVAVQQGPTGSYVFVVDANKTAQMKNVVVALPTGDKVVLESGIEVGDQVVIEGQQQLRAGGKVEIAKPGEAAGAGSGSGDAASAGSGDHHRGSGDHRGSGAKHGGSGSAVTP
ncbi:MAG TPA: efflux RND transporter periplasmic adaptor subunit [Kofleriaceae bacterium]|jgi:multidrug efflux system membrane fusion protein|nr:efflux RND transporter periplasmic adaptor subunit [Kofleriaceae bacterium]